MAEPDRAPGEIEDPDGENDGVKLPAFELADQAEAVYPP